MVSIWPLKSEPLVPLSSVEALAFVLLVFGTLIYNEILILPCEFMNKHTKAKLAKLEGSDDEALQSIRDMNYMATSPTAKYDNNRNMRNIEKG